MITSTESDSARKAGRSIVTGRRFAGKVTRAAQTSGNRRGSRGTMTRSASSPPRLTSRR